MARRRTGAHMRRKELRGTWVLVALAALSAPRAGVAAALEGRVRAAEGGALAGAEVVALAAPAAASDEERFRRAATGEDGAFRLELPDGVASVHVVVRAPGRIAVHVADAAPGVPL